MYPVLASLTYLLVRISGDVVGLQKLLYLRVKPCIPNNKIRSTPKTNRYLYTDSCRGLVPMEPPMSNISMHHQNPNLDFDDTRIFM
jgi:hypothetical protein